MATIPSSLAFVAGTAGGSENRRVAIGARILSAW